MDLSHERLSTNVELDCLGIRTPITGDHNSVRLAQQCQTMMHEAQRVNPISFSKYQGEWLRQNTMGVADRAASVLHNIADVVHDTTTGERSILDITYDDIFGRGGQLLRPRGLSDQIADINQLIQTANGPKDRPSESARQRLGRDHAWTNSPPSGYATTPTKPFDGTQHQYHHRTQATR